MGFAGATDRNEGLWAEDCGESGSTRLVRAMGGLGSGTRWSRRPTVEEAFSLSASAVRRAATRCRPAALHGVSWRCSTSGQALWSCTLEIGPAGDDASRVMVISYASPISAFALTQRVTIVTAPVPFGVRWYFRCPQCSEERRAENLHLAPGALFFAGRRCHRLT